MLDQLVDYLLPTVSCFLCRLVFTIPLGNQDRKFVGRFRQVREWAAGRVAVYRLAVEQRGELIVLDLPDRLAAANRSSISGK